MSEKTASAQPLLPAPSTSTTHAPRKTFSTLTLGVLLTGLLALSSLWVSSRSPRCAGVLLAGPGSGAKANEGLSGRLGYTLVADVPDESIPGRGKKGVKKGDGDDKRLIVVGDVHGMFDEFKSLLDKISYDPDADYLVLAGDIISKGPDSLEVLDLARKIGARCVRGNHEDRILLHWHELRRRRGHRWEEGEDGGFDDLDEKDESSTLWTERKLAKSLSKKQAEWLDACPLVVRAKKVPGLGEYLIVHAGLVHGVELEDQDPVAIMTMRSLGHHLVPSPKQNGMHWAKYWNKRERRKSRDHSTVVYGHYAAEGLDLRHYTKGLDSSCVRGGKLSAYILEANKGGRVGESVVSVKCRKYLD